MSTRKIRCTDCGEAVPYGRLSCPSCGTLLASVSGAVRTQPAPPVDPEPDQMPDETPDETPADEPVMVAVAAVPDPAPAEAPTLKPRPVQRTAPRTPAQRTASVRTLVPTTVVRTVTALAFAPAPAVVASGNGSMPVGPWAAAAADPTPVASHAATPEAATPADRTHLGWFDMSMEHERIGAGLEWAGALGAGLLAIAMLLPWSRSVIGSDGIGYFDSWGLAGPLHVFVLLGALAVLALAMLPNRAPAWIGRGIVPFGLGAFTLGLVWPYVVGPLGGQIGVVLAVIGAVVLVVSGAIGDWHARHAPADPGV